jgi:hypothetical protein
MVSCMKNQIYMRNEDIRNHYFSVGDEYPVSIYGVHTLHSFLGHNSVAAASIFIMTPQQQQQNSVGTYSFYK